MTILQQAQKLAARYSTNNPREILHALGIVVMEVPIEGIRGIYKRVQRNTFVFVDSSLDERTQLFVLGHELGHHIYHRGQNRVFLDRYTLMVPSKAETEADTFSVCLMGYDPSEIVFEGEGVEQIAARLGVEQRLAWLYREELRKNRYFKQ